MNVYTLPAFRWQGLSRQLLQELIAFAKDHGVERLWLNTGEMGRPLYEHLGFIEEDDSVMELYIK